MDNNKHKSSRSATYRKTLSFHESIQIQREQETDARDPQVIEVVINERLGDQRQDRLQNLISSIEQAIDSNHHTFISKKESDSHRREFMENYAKQKQSEPQIFKNISSHTDTFLNNRAFQRDTRIGVKKALKKFKPTYEDGKDVLQIEDIVGADDVGFLENNDSLDLDTMEEKDLIKMFKQGYNQLDARKQIVEENEKMHTNSILLSKFFAQRYSYLIKLKKDKFGTIHKLPLRFIIFLNQPKNSYFKQKFISNVQEDETIVRSINNGYYDPFNNSSSNKEAKKKSMVLGSLATFSLAKGKLNSVILNNIVDTSSIKTWVKTMEEQDDFQFDYSGSLSPRSKSTNHQAPRKSVAPPTAQSNKNSATKYELKVLLKPRQKTLLKKLIRVHILQNEAPELLRRNSFEMNETQIVFPRETIRTNMCERNRMNFSMEEEYIKKVLVKMKRLNKLEFKGVNLKQPQEDEITKMSIHYWNNNETSKKKIEKRTAIEMDLGSIASTNVMAKIVLNYPHITFKDIINLGLENPENLNPHFVVLIGYRLYVFENENAKKAKIAFEIEPREIEKMVTQPPGYFILKNQIQLPLFISLEKQGLQLLLLLEDVVGYQCCINAFDLQKKLKSMTPTLSNYFQNHQEKVFHTELISGGDKQRGTSSQIYDQNADHKFDAEIEKCYFVSLRSLKFHNSLIEISLIKVRLSPRCVDYIFQVVGAIKLDLKVLRFEKNEFKATICTSISNYFKSPQFNSLDVFSIAENDIGDEGLSVLLTPIEEKLEVDLFKYSESAKYPIHSLNLSHCGLTGVSLSKIEVYIKTLEKVRLATNRKMIHNHRFNLDLSRNLLIDNDFVSIISILQQTFCLTSLSLDENYKITTQGLIKFFGCLDFVSSLEWFSIRELYIDSRVLPYLCRFLYRNVFLNRIVLSFDKQVLLPFLKQKSTLAKYYLLEMEEKESFGNSTYRKANIKQRKNDMQLSYTNRSSILSTNR